jgi:hypothetical protein
MTADATALRVATAITWSLTGLFFTIAIFVALVIPIHAQDALTFGEWSRLISEHWHLHYAAATAQEYGRPLFYVLQGWVWGLFGFSETTGRILSGLFSLLLLGALVLLLRNRQWGGLVAGLAALALVATPVFAIQIVSGLTDIPVAALVALAGALVWGDRPGPVRAGAATLAAMLAMLAKPSALLALVGLAAAQLLVREPWRLRLVYRIAPIAVGVGLGLVYDLVQAHHVSQGLRTFLQSGVNTDFYRALADEARRFVLLDAGWFGDGLRVALLFAAAYTLLRLVGTRHRVAVLTGVAIALVGSWFGPWLAGREERFGVGSLHSTGAALAAIGTAAFLALGTLAYGEAIASANELARFAVWALPTVVAWAIYGAYDLRLLAPAWPPLLALIAVTALPAAVAATQRGPIAIAIPIALFAVVVASNVYNVDGLGKSGWSEVRRTPVGKWSDRSTMRSIVMPAFSHTLDVVRPQMGPHDLLVSPEGAFRFFFPGRVEQSFPNSCEFLNRFRVFVLTTDEGTKRYMRDFLHVSPEPSFWARCAQPHLTQLTDGSEGYVVFRVEKS